MAEVNSNVLPLCYCYMFVSPFHFFMGATLLLFLNGYRKREMDDGRV